MTASRVNPAARAAYLARIAATMAVPPAAVLARLLTRADMDAYPDYFGVDGPGHDLAAASNCGHGYSLNDSCPGCDYDADQAAPDPVLCAHGYSLSMADLACPNCRRHGVTPAPAAQ